jgi:hypothetical protein
MSSQTMRMIAKLVRDAASAIKRIDTRGLTALNARTGQPYVAGFGPFPETQAVTLMADELRAMDPVAYSGLALGVPYPGRGRQTCDLCVREGEAWRLAVEVKLLRMMGDNGKPNANMLMHILSPYAKDRNAYTDCVKLANSEFPGTRAVMIYGFEFGDYPLEPAIEAFELLARSKVTLGERCVAQFDELVHPVHRAGRVYGWEVTQRAG